MVKLPRKLSDFRSIVRKGMILDKEQEDLFYEIPENIWKDFLEINFKDNLEYARRVILSKVDIIEELDVNLLDKEKEKINNLQFAADKVNTYLANSSPILFITDYDNDGSMSQTVINQFINIEKQALNINQNNVYVEYARAVNGNQSRGLTLELVEDLVEEKGIDINQPFLLITADNGINSLIEQKRIQAKFPQVDLIITDHHEPENGMLIEENEKTIIVNPKYNAMVYQSQEMQKERGNKEYPSYFEKYNISGATTIAVLLKQALKKYDNTDVVKNTQYKEAIDIINKVTKASNILDYVNSAPEDKLYITEEITKYVEKQSLLNTNNSMAKFITGNDNEINSLSEILGHEKVEEIQKNVFVLNKYAQVILSIMVDYQNNKNDSLLNVELKDLIKEKNTLGFNQNFLQLISTLEYFDEDESLKNNSSKDNILGLLVDQDDLKSKKSRIEFELRVMDDEKASDDVISQKRNELLKVEKALDEVEKILDKEKVSDFDKTALALSATGKLLSDGKFVSSNNKNYIEQLRPYIFSILANDSKDSYETDALEMALKIFNRLRAEEKELMVALREAVNNKDLKAKIFKEFEEENANILVVNPYVSSMLNRKIINKAFNQANNGFYLVLDGLSENKEQLKISGSFRSQFDIDAILTKEVKVLFNEAIKLETPGHKQAAGFILTIDKNKLKEMNIEFNQADFLKQLTSLINKQVASLKKAQEEKVLKDASSKDDEEAKIITEIESDVFNIDFINSLNETVRGHIPHFKAINPLVKLHEDFVIVNQSTGKQIALKDFVEKHNYGYAHLQIQLPKNGDKAKSLIIPVELLRKVVNSGKDKDGYYLDFIRLGYLDDGLFMVNQVVKNSAVNKDNLLLIQKDLKTSRIIDEAYSDGKLDKVVEVSREQLKNLDFFKLDRYGERNFELFENLLIQIIEREDVEMYTTFDVEANGFSRAKMFNLGTANFEINKESGKTIDYQSYADRTFYSLKNKQYLLDEEEMKTKLRLLTRGEYESYLNKNDLTHVLFKVDRNSGKKVPYLYESDKKEKVNNVKMIYVDEKSSDVKEVIYNREIKASTLSRLVKEDDFNLPIYMTYLTGVKNQHLDKYGKPIAEVDEFFTNFYKDKKIIIGAHNTRYDLGICEANMKNFYNQILTKNKLFDSCMFAKTATTSYESGSGRTNPLAYDNMAMVKFVNVPEIGRDVIFYNNRNSKLNLTKFLEEKEGQFPDRTGNYRLSFEDGELYYYTYKNNTYEKAKISVPYEDLRLLKVDPIAEKEEKPELTREDLGDVTNEVDKGKKAKKTTKKATKKEEKPVSAREMYISSRDFEAQSQSESGRMKVQERLPINSIRYSAQTLSDYKMIRNLLMDEQDFSVKMIEDFDKYPTLKDYKVELQEFLHTYRFDKDFFDNLMDERLSFIERSYAMQADLIKLEKDFMELNQELANCFNDAWYYKEILSLKDPQYKDLNQETYEVISTQTGFSVDIVKEVLNKAYNFKQKYGVKDLMQPEIHVNGPINGDVMFETPLTLTLLASKTMETSLNSGYGRNYLIKPVEIFHEKSFDFTIDARNNKDERMLAEDSMGYVQLLDYKRDKNSQSNMVKEYQRQYEYLENFDEMVLHFKLKTGVLQPDTHISAISIQELDIDTIREDATKIAEIVKIDQCYVGDSEDYTKGINKILDENKQRKQEIMDELSTRYRYLELYQGVKQKGKLNEFIYETDFVTQDKDKFVKKLVNFLAEAEDLTINEFKNKLFEVNYRQQEYMNKYEHPHEFWGLIAQHLEKHIHYLESIEYKTPLEQAYDSGENFVKRYDCLNGKVTRMNPMKYMLDHFDLIDLTKEYVVGKYDLGFNHQYNNVNQAIDNKIKMEENNHKRTI